MFVRIWRHRSRPKLAQVMACCLTAPSHYLNQSWLHTSADWQLSSGLRQIHMLSILFQDNKIKRKASLFISSPSRSECIRYTNSESSYEMLWNCIQIHAFKVWYMWMFVTLHVSTYEFIRDRNLLITCRTGRCRPMYLSFTEQNLQQFGESSSLS